MSSYCLLFDTFSSVADQGIELSLGNSKQKDYISTHL